MNIASFSTYPITTDRKEQVPASKLAARPTPKVDIKLQNDITQVKDVFQKFRVNVEKYDKASHPDKFEKATENNKENNEKEVAIAGLSIIPFYRRFVGIEEAANNKDLFKATAKGLIALINVPEDTSDLIKVKNQIKSKIKNEDLLIPHDYQTKFSFFRGTLFEPVLKRLVDSKNARVKKIGKRVYNADKTLFDSLIGEKLCKLFKVEIADVKDTTRIDKIAEMAVKTYKLEGNPIGKFICRSLLRMPIISVAVISAIELPTVISSFFKKDNAKDNLTNGAKQTAKSVFNIFAITSITALIGALFASRKGHIGSLVGIGLGSFIGSQITHSVDKIIDEQKV